LTFLIDYGKSKKEAQGVEGMAEAQEVQAEAQAIEGYGCTCGFRTTDNKEISSHVFGMSRQDGKGTHRSLGRINLQTGEVIMPPYRSRTAEQKQQSKYAKKSGITQGGVPVPPQRTTETLANAQELRFVPRVYTTDYSPIIRAAQDAAVEFWKWPNDMSLGDFLDTALHLLFREHGITLAGYTISDEAREALEEEMKAREVEKEPEEVAHGS